MNSKQRANSTLIGSIIVIAAVYGSYSVLSNYISPLCQRLNASVTQVTVLFSVAAVASLVSNLTLGSMLKKFSSKSLVLIGGFCFLGFFLCIRFAGTLSVVYFGATLFGISNALAGFSVIQPLILQWHVKDAAMKTSILTMSSPLLGMLLSPILSSALEKLGFEKTAMLHGLFLGGLCIVSCMLLISNGPETYHLKPLGYEDAKPASKNAETKTQALEGMDLRECLKRPACWALFASLAIGGFANTGFQNNASTIYQSMGLTAVTAAKLISVYNLFSLIWTFLYGKLGDRFGPRFSNLLFCGIGALSFLAGYFLTGPFGAVAIAVALGVMKYNGMAGAVSVKEVFGPAALGALNPMAMAMNSVGTMIGAPVAGAIFEKTGSYAGFMLLSGVLMIAAAALLAYATAKKQY